MALILHSKHGTGHVDISEASLTKNSLCNKAMLWSELVFVSLATV